MEAPPPGWTVANLRSGRSDSVTAPDARRPRGSRDRSLNPLGTLAVRTQAGDLIPTVAADRSRQPHDPKITLA
jgi:hypothetical protein